jgi:predicted TIM-barrel fold metal-dependent hydrolase
LSFCRGEIQTEAILAETGIEVRDLEDLRAAMSAIFQRSGPLAVAVKAQHAYNRTLLWKERSDDEARSALTSVLRGLPVDEPVRLALGDWCWARGVELAIEHNLPFKIHVGYHAGTGSMPIDWVRPANLCALLARYPEARFVLMHAAYPYGDELVALAKHYPNVWVDLCWAWAINPHSTLDFVRRFIHAVPSTKLFAFGGDTIWPTNVVGAALQARLWLTRALEAEVATGCLTEPGASAVARRVMHDNQYACFDIEGTRAALLAPQAAHV